jgi:hypothetical protein
MKILWTLFRIPLLVFDLPVWSLARPVTEAERSVIAGSLSAGDLLLTSDRLFPAWQIAVGVAGSPRYSHAAVYAGGGAVIEATTFHPSGFGVARTGVVEFLTGRKSVCVLRPPYPSAAARAALLAWLEQQLGKPYDYRFSRRNPDAMYCAKLVAHALLAAGLPDVAVRRRFYLPDDFLKASGMTVVCRTCRPPAALLWHNLPAMLAAALCFVGIVPPTLACLALVAAGWGQYAGAGLVARLRVSLPSLRVETHHCASLH